MGARLRSWWQFIKTHRVTIQFIAIFLAIAIILILVGYLFGWTGFNGYSQMTIARTTSGTNAGTVVRTEVSQPGKTLWDWLQLLIVPLVLAIGGLLFSQVQKTTEQRRTTDNQREAALQSYIDKISELLLKEHLGERTADGKLNPLYEQVRNVARVRTITVLTQLDARRIGYVFAFLREAGLMSNKPNSSIVSLSQADLSKINLSQADLRGADLQEANLSEAHLSNANLTYTNLTYADLTEAYLTEAYLYQANLSKANFSKASLTYAILNEADLFAANLSKANLSVATLSVATLREANLSNANLSKATLSKAYLSNANLYQANLSKAYLGDALQLHLFGSNLP